MISTAVNIISDGKNKDFSGINMISREINRFSDGFLAEVNIIIERE
ncbi:MAG: hypothetical protein M1495_01690 [Bacteroidetes bacterium]|nr:hypothetical protein [Bacteroidota bacterium]